MDNKRGAAAAAADVDHRRQQVTDTLQLLQQREQRVQEAERCVTASYLYFCNLLRVQLPPPSFHLHQCMGHMARD
jgi:hypothetical protein